MKQIFSVGNKRSGTSLVVRLLNLHPRLFISHESDIIWILYQSRRWRPIRYRCYKWDGPVGMQATLAACRSIIKKNLKGWVTQEALIRTFYDVQQHLMLHGSGVQQPYQKSDLLWIGDKKPVQQADPVIHSFTAELFPDARYLHLVRHPRSVVASMEQAAATWDVVPNYWKKGRDAILARWAAQEEWVLKLKERQEGAVYTVRLEDLSASPIEQMGKIFDFLHLDSSPQLHDQIREVVRPGQHRKHADTRLSYPTPVRRLMDIYGYEP